MWKSVWVYMRGNVKLLRLRKRKANEEKSNGRGITDSRSSLEDSDREPSSDEGSQDEEQATAAAVSS